MSSPQGNVPGNGPLDVARKEMRPHERLVWADRPTPSGRGTPALGRVAFGVLFGGFAVFWTSAAWLMTRGAPSGAFGVFFPLFGVPFIAVGAGIVVAGIRSWREGGGTVYALSDQRVLIISGGRARTVRSLDLTAIRGVERAGGVGGSGTISLLIEGTDAMREVLSGVPDAAHVGAEIERLRGLAQGTGAPPAS
jgi:hypothetical protein